MKAIARSPRRGRAADLSIDGFSLSLRGSAPQANRTATLRRRIEAPTIPKPPIIIAQVAGSGTAAVTAEMRICAAPDVMLERLKVPILNTGVLPFRRE